MPDASFTCLAGHTAERQRPGGVCRLPLEAAAPVAHGSTPYRFRESGARISRASWLVVNDISSSDQYYRPGM